jgi:hypothetical protein
MSACRTTYVWKTAPEIPVQLTPFTPPPLVSQRSQRYENLNGVVPDHEPLTAVSRLPSNCGPVIRGSPLF